MLFNIVNERREYHPRILGFIKHDDNRLIPELQKMDIKNAADSSGITLLHLAARHGNSQLTVHLKRSQACQIDAQDHSGTTPLMLAVQHQQVLQVKMLLNFKAQIHLKNKSGDNALKIALKYCHIRDGYIIMTALLKKLTQMKNHKEIVQILKDANCPLYRAVYANVPEAISIYIDSGMPINMQNDNNGNTALHMAAMLDDPSMIDMLLEKGADARIKNTCDGYTPLVLSLQCTTSKDIKEINHLCNNVKSWTDRGPNGKLLLHPIFSEGAMHTLNLFLKTYKIDFNAKDLHGMTSLHYLAEHENTKAIELIQNFELDVNAQDGAGRTALHIAVLRRATNIVEFLLKKGANINIKDDEGRTPLFWVFLDICEKVDYYEVLTMTAILLQNGANPEILSENKSSVIKEGLKREDRLLEPIIAHLAMSKVLGKPINNLIQQQIDEYASLKNYYQSCCSELQVMMGRVVYGSVTFFDILTAGDAKLEEYAANLKGTDIIFGTSRETITKWYYRYVFRKKYEKIAKISDVKEIFEERKKLLADQMIQYVLNDIKL